MAMAYCMTCDTYKDLDIEGGEGQWNDDGEYCCESCIEQKEAEHDGNPEPN